MSDTLITWGQSNFSWGNSSFTWGDVVLVKAALGGGGIMADDMPWTKWEDDKKEKLIKLICKVKGKTYKQTKQVKDIKITTKDIRLLAERVLGIEVITENVKF
tara:strand:+ start:185 stop:493 length:309 start_codon:yes stop_codon:yes gene_type:complete